MESELFLERTDYLEHDDADSPASMRLWPGVKGNNSWTNLEGCWLGKVRQRRSAPRSWKSPPVISTPGLIWRHDCLIERLRQYIAYMTEVTCMCLAKCACLIVSLRTLHCPISEIDMAGISWRSQNDYLVNFQQTHFPFSYSLDYDAHCWRRWRSLVIANLKYLGADLIWRTIEWMLSPIDFDGTPHGTDYMIHALRFNGVGIPWQNPYMVG